jgi:hypothetical protein
MTLLIEKRSEVLVASIMFSHEFTSGDFSDRLNLGERVRPVYGLGFRKGKLINVYSYSLYWLVHYGGLTNVISEVLNGGEPVLYGELSFKEVSLLVAKGGLRNLRRHSWGISWPFKSQVNGADDDFSGFKVWREKMLGEADCFQGFNDLNETPAWLLS